MEVVVTEEKKKIFRARKTMKISDRQQLESLHSTLLTAAPGLSGPSPPPLMNGTHKEDGQKLGDKEQNNISDSNSPHAASPASPAPYLSLNLSPSPSSSQSPKAKDETLTSPTSPFHSLNSELKKMEEEKKGSSSSSSNVTLATTESKEKWAKDTEVVTETEKKLVGQTATEDKAVVTTKESVKGSAPCSPLSPTMSDCTKPMNTASDTSKAKDTEASTTKVKDGKPPSPKSIKPDSSPACPSSSHPASSSCADLKQEKEIKDQDIKEEKDDKEDVKKASVSEEKMELDVVKEEIKREKTTKPSRPSSTPPSNTEKGSTSGLKRTYSEGYEKDGQTVKREAKRPKVKHDELEAQLELKITAKTEKAHHKLEKIVQQLVDERLRVLELTIFDKHFQELKDRVDKIDCATKHQTAITTLQAKIARLSKKFGEANQVSENKRKQETLAAVTSTAATVAQAAAVSNNSQAQRVVRTSLEAKQTPTTVSSPIVPETLQMVLDSEEEFTFSSEEERDSDDERLHFEERLDPAEDIIPDETVNTPLTPSPASCKGSGHRCEKNRAKEPVAKRAKVDKKPTQSWKTETDVDMAPQALRFLPTQEPGPQLRPCDAHTPMSLFKMFFSETAMSILCRNTNAQAARSRAKGHKYKCSDVSISELYRYIGLLFYMAMVKLRSIRDYWRRESLFSVPFPATVMSRDRYRTISWNLHMSHPDADKDNDGKRGTAAHDRLFRVRPLMDSIRLACKAIYHPRRNLAVDERMVACKANTGMTQYVKAKPTRWGFKLFVLADSSNGYTVDFAVYTGKNNFPTGHGLPYDAVTSLLDRTVLGSGYHVYMDNFYTSPKLLTDLFALKFGACGTYRDNRKDCPQNAANSLTNKSVRGSIRWIRDGHLVFVKWMDTREVSVCSTIHAAYTGDTVQRRVKTQNGWRTKTFPCPAPVTAYNHHMGGVDLSDQLLQYYTTQHKTMKWYRKLFLHFLDIAATNAYIVHKELYGTMSHKEFMEELIAELCGVSQKITPKRSSVDHVPVPGAGQASDATAGRRICVLCKAKHANPALPAPAPAPGPSSTSTAMVPQAPILQLITSTSNVASTLATGITTQSPTGTLLLKTASGSSVVAPGQPLLIQLPISMTNGQTGTLVNIPVSSLSAASSLNKAKTTASTATFILKPASTTTTAPVSAPTVATVPTLQPSTVQMSSAQISIARPVYQGGAGTITTPNAGVSVTTARTPVQSVSVAGAMSSASSPAASGPAATGSTAPGPPQGTSLTSKTDNQATGSNASKSAAPAARPKGSVIDLTEDDDDVQVTGVKNATVPSPSLRPHPVVSIPNSAGARSSPQSIQNPNNPQLTVHHRPQLDSSMKPRTVTTTTPTRGTNMVLPPLPPAPAPQRLPPEAERTSPPQQPQLKLVPSQTGIVLSWCVSETDRTCAAVDSYHLYAFHQDNSNTNSAQQHWKKIGEVKALPLPMACTLTQFQSGSTYHFAVRAKDIYGRFGTFCEPQCTNVISASSN
ncbi:activating transcription factor 7-interacting protein 1 isoform X2 [Mastacembelus armatus]|uniref:activating transcription factor 7-interacting protein 1 isoform X2 n=1 Tax=Mastacembelus armatus TaxID=205130 RepID=UPI000E456965|nr:activating transcription factor 7-interacting protein 1-like isoform X2 [Mastacembelus armatus]